MKNNSDKFDHLIALAAAKCAEEEARALDEIDTSDVVFDNAYYRKRNKTINRFKRKSRLKLAKSVAVRVAAAIMIMITITCVLIGCVPRWREAIFEAIVKWYDNCFSVGYENPDTGEEMETGYQEESASETEEVIVVAPTMIESIRKPSDLPEGVWEDVIVENKTNILIDYYYGDQYIFSFSQFILKPNDSYVDNEDVDVTHIKIDGNDATVVEYLDKNEINVFWNDGEYSYQIFSPECDFETVISYAKSVK